MSLPHSGEPSPTLRESVLLPNPPMLVVPDMERLNWGVLKEEAFSGTHRVAFQQLLVILTLNLVTIDWTDNTLHAMVSVFPGFPQKARYEVLLAVLRIA